MGMNLRFLCNSLGCFPVFLVITFHKDPHIIISGGVVPAVAADGNDANNDNNNNNNNNNTDGRCEGPMLLLRISIGT